MSPYFRKKKPLVYNMVFRLARRTRNTRRAGRRSLVRPRRAPRLGWRSRMMYNPVPTFTETIDLQPIVMTYQPGGQGFAKGIFQVQPSQIPQMPNYQALYNQIKIRKVRLIIVPNYNFESLNGVAGASIVPAVTTIRMAYSVNNTSGAVPPTTELDVLNDNGCKIVTINRPKTITFRPVPDLGLTNASSAAVAVSNRNTWLTTSPLGVATVYGGVSYFFTQDYAPNNPPISFNVYAKVTFSLRDPK